MPNALEKIQAGADKVNTKLASKGFREHSVAIIQFTRAGKDPDRGNKGTMAVASTTTITPAPKIAQVSLQLAEKSGGVILAGDLRISGISRLTIAATVLSDPDRVWRITGPVYAGDYQLIRLDVKDTEVIAIVRKKAVAA